MLDFNNVIKAKELKSLSESEEFLIMKIILNNIETSCLEAAEMGELSTIFSIEDNEFSVVINNNTVSLNDYILEGLKSKGYKITEVKVDKVQPMNEFTNLYKISWE